MREFRLRPDLERAVIGGFSLPLGFVPGADAELVAPTIGYTVDYTPGEDDEPDTYAIYVVAPHERLSELLHRVFELLPETVHGILEIGSRDAYRSLDVYLAPEPISRDQFLDGWKEFEPFLLEDGLIGSGANSDDPFVEVFLDQWKGVSVHVPLSMREDVEAILHVFGLEEVGETWPPMDEDEANRALHVRPVLAEDDEYAPGVDEMLLHLRQAWQLELNVDRDTNVDESGRDLGRTLWHAMVIVESVENPETGGYASIWATAASLGEMEDMIHGALQGSAEWRFNEVYTIDRVAYDERPDALADLSPRGQAPGVHLLEYET